DIVVHLDRYFGVPVLLVEVDVGDIADRHIVHLDTRSRYEFEHVGELDRDLVRIVTEFRAAGQREIVDTFELAATSGDGQQACRDQQCAQFRLQTPSRGDH